MSHDSDGNPVIEVDPLSSVGQFTALMEWARRRGFRIGPTVKIGDLVVQVSDLRQTEARGEPLPPDVGPWTQAGFPQGDE